MLGSPPFLYLPMTITRPSRCRSDVARRTSIPSAQALRLACGFCAALLGTTLAFATEPPSATAQARKADGCYARLAGDVLHIGNGKIERRWQVEPDGGLAALSLRDVSGRFEWVAARAPANAGSRAAAPDAHLSVVEGKAGATEAPSLQATLVVRAGDAVVTHRFQIFPGAAAIATDRSLTVGNAAAAPDTEMLARLNRIDGFVPAPAAFQLTRLRFHGQTDVFEGPLVVEIPVAGPTPADDADVEQAGTVSRFRGNVFFIEDPKTAAGVLFLKHAPLPNERPRAMDAAGKVINRLFDLTRDDQQLGLNAHELTATGGTSYRTATVVYQGGRAGRIAALQKYHRQLRVYEPGRDGLLLCNAWGEWNSSTNLSESFLQKEIPAAAGLGVDVFEIDAGWQQGTYPAALDKKKRTELGHYGLNPNYWNVHEKKFPQGLGSYVAQIKALGMKAGIWIAPDSVNEFAMADQDKARVLALFQEGFTYFKFDLLRIYTPRAEERFHRLLEAVINETDGRLTVDLDVTGAHTPRPGYFGNPHHGPIFVENRWTHYAPQAPTTTPTDFWPRKDRWWPHRTLRNLWLLSQYVDPVRLRMEFMNNLRQQDKYGDDPLAPANWSPAYVFATVMCSSPLAWMEVQQLPEAYVQQVAPLVAVWKAHREKMFSGSVIPIGAEPSGHSWTGFLSVNEARNGGYALLYRELNDQSEWEMDLPLLARGSYDAVPLAGEGTVRVVDGKLRAEIRTARQFLFVELRPVAR